MAVIYDTIGTTYSLGRRSDPRIASVIERALEGCASVLNVGAGAGSYEPRHCNLIALEPSRVMILQRAVDAAPVVQARAEALPFADRSFDAVLGVLTAHHWSDQTQGFAECARVARDRVVFLTIDPEVLKEFWIYRYFPSLLTIDGRIFPGIERFAEAFASVEVKSVPIPADCCDGFLGAYWRRPSAYLDPLVRHSISTFSMINAREIDLGLEELQSEVKSGAWAERHAAIKDLNALDVGYRIVIGATGRAR